MPSFSQENYLKSLWPLSSEGKVTLQRLASHLRISPASAYTMVKKLQDAKLVTYDRGQGIRLTKRGQKIALEIVRRHRLWEMFLYRMLNYQWEEVHDLAEQLEHIASPDLADRLDALLGYPDYDPHGDPIPRKDGTLPFSTAQPLVSQQYGWYRVTGLKRNDRLLLEHLNRLYLFIGTTIELSDRLPYDGSLVVKVGTTYHYLSPALAELILVEPTINN
ncbi:MAG: metal-dependent transcriptional regulator [Bacteroidota bacterium]|nr:metal-dependent transcriptional regulator [Candidatus Kapabacteria bacterium]MDW8075973.1 metal-dependent transcriptional regulator [Bacteroidota bacterium]